MSNCAVTVTILVPPGNPNGAMRLVVLEHDCRGHVVNHAFARGGKIGVAGNKGEAGHTVGHKKTKAVDDFLRAEEEALGGGHGDKVLIVVDGEDVGGMRDIEFRGGSSGADTTAHLGGLFGGAFFRRGARQVESGHSQDRPWSGGGPARPIRCAGEMIEVVNLEWRQVRNVEMFKHFEDLQGAHAAGRRWWRVDLMAPVSDGNRV